MIYSSLITAILNFIITTLGLCQCDILKIKYCKLDIIEKKTKEVLNCIKCKITIFFIITYIFLILFWAYLGCFCAVYKNTQIHLISDTLISFGTSMIYPFGMYLIPGIFRIIALKKKKKKCMYNFSKITDII